MDAADLAFAGLTRQLELLDAGEVSSRELVEVYLRRIERLDPAINAYRVVFAEQALAAADQADGRRRAGDRRPLLGIPIAIKDDCDVAGETTPVGTNAFDGSAPADAEVVRRLRAAGSVLLGKTHVPELTITPFTESPTFGATRNPWDLQRTPGGSSGGSGAAVAAGLCAAALGSDGAGSIRIPAGCCGLFGLKPQRGRVPTHPKVEPWQGLAIWGPLSRTVADSARFYDAIKDGGPSFAEAAARQPGRLRIAVSLTPPAPLKWVRPDAEQRGAVLTTADLLRDLGHEVVEREIDYGPATGSNVVVRYVRGIHDDAGAMAHPRRLSRRTRSYARLGRMIPPAVVERAKAAAAADAERIGRIFADGIDVVLTPMFTRRPFRIGEMDGRGALWTLQRDLMFVPYCGPFNHTGQPAAAVPAGFAADGFPLTAQLVGRPDGEPALLSLAAQLEQARDWAAHRPAVAA
jgi:amidase